MWTSAEEVEPNGSWRAWLFDRGPSAWTYILRMGLTSLLPSLVVAALLMATLSVLGHSDTTVAPDFKGPPPIVSFIAVVVISPFFETLFLSLGIALFSVVTKRPFVIATLSALVWGVLHSTAFLFWGVVIAWPFFVFSCAYLAWRPVGWSKAIGVVTCIHMFQNLIPGLLLFFGGVS
jgi:hypothetical protein